MTKEQRLALINDRINRMEHVKALANIKCPGALRALKRERENLIKSL